MIIKSPIYPRFLRRENSLLCSCNYSWRESARREKGGGRRWVVILNIVTGRVRPDWLYE